MPDVLRVADIETESGRMVPSAHLSLRDVIVLSLQIRRAFKAKRFDAAVVTQGTDTLEETVFALDLLIDHTIPVVVTGAMRNPSLPGADGPANLVAAVDVAVGAIGKGLGCLIVLNDEVHAARYVRKTHTTSPAAFASPMAGPIGWVRERSVRIVTRLKPLPTLAVNTTTAPPPVALLPASMGDNGALLRCVSQIDFSGLVVEGFGGGHVPHSYVEALDELAKKIPVAITSRAGAGETLTSTYAFPGSEQDLLSRGVISGSWLSGPQARVLMSLQLTCTSAIEEVAAMFSEVVNGGVL